MRNRKALAPHYKSMNSYLWFAWNDAMELASLLEDRCDIKFVRDFYEGLSAEDMFVCEGELQHYISNLLQKTVAQRPAYLRKMGKDHPGTNIPDFVLLLALIAQVRVTEIMDVRDRFRGALAPGEGNRITCAGLYDFGIEMAKLHQQKPVFPYQVFRSYGSAAFEGDERARNAHRPGTPPDDDDFED